ncbi:MAG: twin-arginine translocase TatA/TatE family subunit [Deltaproteobacteria bacterium]|nr:twin-arginine translocase TatA/TatE family subunit [Deltaproteobacteria bacterium]
MFGLGTSELIVIGVIVFLIFGAKRLPEIGKGLGGAIREFRQVKKDLVGKREKPKEGEIPPVPPLAKGGEGGGPEKGDGGNFQNKLAQKALEQVPGVKKALDLKNKVNKVKDIVK